MASLLGKKINEMQIKLKPNVILSLAFSLASGSFLLSICVLIGSP